MTKGDDDYHRGRGRLCHSHFRNYCRQIPSISILLEHETVQNWLAEHPRSLVTECLRAAVAALREQILADSAGRCGAMHVTPEYLLEMAGQRLQARTQPHIRGAINATGIILHTGLGRAVWPACVVTSMADELRGYVKLAIDTESGERIDRDELVEYILTELTGAEAATVVNNNAAATMLVLAALAAQKEVIVSRGQLIEIGGSFRLPEVMAQSRARLVEVGATNRTHLTDYQKRHHRATPPPSCACIPATTASSASPARCRWRNWPSWRMRAALTPDRRPRRRSAARPGAVWPAA